MTQKQSYRQVRWKIQAGVLTRALPYMQRYSGCIMVIKYGGHAMINKELSLSFAHDINLLKQIGMHPIIIHGGGPQIDALLKKLNIKSDYVDGLRKTDSQTMEAVEMALLALNKRIVMAIAASGGKAVGLSGKDAGLMIAKKWQEENDHNQKIDLGFVGVPEKIDISILESLRQTPFIPVITPIAADENGVSYNINADIFAGAIAAALKAKRFFLLSDIPGVLDENGDKISSLTPSTTKALIKKKIASGGMIPKLETCLHALKNDVEGAVILDGRIKNSLLIELFTKKGHGTLIC